jgi:hypothetical protein
VSDPGIVIPVVIEGQRGEKTLEDLAAELKKVEQAQDRVAKTAKSSNAAFAGLAKSALAYGATLFGLQASIRFVTESIALQAEQEKAVNQLNLALANQGNLLDGTSERLQEFASAQQAVTIFGDEAILGLQAQLAGYGQAEEQIIRSTKAALDFAAATGRDLRSAGDLVGKAFVGSTGELSRYGIVLDEGLDKTEKFDAVLDQLSTRFGGSAAAATQTFTGGVQQLGNTFGDTQEAFGKFLGFLTSNGQQAFSGFTSVLERVAKFFSQDLIIALSEARARFSEFLAAWIDGFAEIGDVLNRIPGIDIDTAALRLRAEDQRVFAEELRATGDAAAQSVGNIQQFDNQLKTLDTTVRQTDEELKALQKREEEVAKAFQTLTGTLDPAKFGIVAEAVGRIDSAC